MHPRSITYGTKFVVSFAAVQPKDGEAMDALGFHTFDNENDAWEWARGVTRDMSRQPHVAVYPTVHHPARVSAVV